MAERRSTVKTPDSNDNERLYRLMVRMRLVEEALVNAWDEGLVPGEYHSAIGEEGINAGIVAHLSGQDSMALDHRNTSPFIARGTDPESLMLEVLGSDEGINSGMAGHMHIFDPDAFAGADGMVGAAGPLAVGQAIAHNRVHPGRVAIAYHGEAAMNQGMLMESYNMAVSWNLPVIFVCKDNKWGITTYSKDVTGANPISRAKGFGLHVATAQGHLVHDVHRTAGRLIERARAGKGPSFLYVTCYRPGGHFEGDPFVTILRNVREEVLDKGADLQRGVLAEQGGTTSDRIKGVAELAINAGRFARDAGLGIRKDPVRRGRSRLKDKVAQRIENEERIEISEAMRSAREKTGHRKGFGVKPGQATVKHSEKAGSR